MHTLKNVWAKFISLDNGVRAVIKGTHNKRQKREVSRLLYSDGGTNPAHFNMIDLDKAKSYVQPIIYELMSFT